MNQIYNIINNQQNEINKLKEINENQRNEINNMKEKIKKIRIRSCYDNYI